MSRRWSNLPHGASRAALLLLCLGGLLRLALGAVALHARLLHARVLRLAFLVVALLLRDVVGGLGLRFLHLLLGLGLVLRVLRVELGLGDLLLAFGFRRADVLGVGLHGVALLLLRLVRLLDALLLLVLHLALGGIGALLGARLLGRVAFRRGLGGLRLRRSGERECHGEGDARKFQRHRRLLFSM